MTTAHTVYSNLLAPLDLGFATLRNRFLMRSMHSDMEDFFWHYDKLAAYFAERAAGGVGLIVTGGIAPNIAGWMSPLAGRNARPSSPARPRNWPLRSTSGRPSAPARGRRCNSIRRSDWRSAGHETR